jgi:hypothetical protein
MNEGSQEIDDGGMPSVTVNDDQSQDETIEVRDEGEDQGGESQETETQNQGEQGKEQFTEKGTRLDPNPLSAAHQELANERRLRQQFQAVLSDPVALRKYAKEAGYSMEEAKAEIKEEQAKLYTPDRFKTPEDVANALNEMHASNQKTVAELRSENQRLREGFSGFSQSRHIEQVANNMQSDIGTIREKYPELNPKSTEYDPELEKEIGSFYHELDFDPDTGGYKGNFSIASIAERVMRAAGRAKKQGSEQAQTNVRVKQAGKVVTSSKNTSKEVQESRDPGTVIAQRIAKAMGNG